MELKEYQNVIFIILTIVGIGFLAISVFLLKFPPKKINGLYGYRTSRSMQSQEAWDYSQLYSSKIMIALGFVYTFLGLGSLFVPKQEDMIGSIISIIIVLSGVFFMFFKTERELAKKFDF